ncbi:methyl-accepting chemotaxis protein [Chitinibacter tainanensis]|uniref:methyl-accepting chemotaxis protein n=1 Tax=Chitinibacter tainanensis TaxID=230667 RepID=UPI0004139330|nr:methyl-accepting chemotaxis protein [Chitinibacter tainanensis]
MNNWGVKTRLMAGFGLVLGLLVVLTAAALYSLQSISGKIEELVGERYPAVVVTQDLIIQAYNTDLLFRNAALAENFEEMEKIIAVITQEADQEEAAIAKLKAMPLDAQAKTLLAEVERANAAMDKQKATLISQLKLDRAVGATFINTTYAKVSNEYRNAVLQLGKQQGEMMEQGKASMGRTSGAAHTVIVVTAIIAIVAGLVFAALIANQVIGSLATASSVAEKIAAGDLTHDWRAQRIGKDEIGVLLGALKKMQDNLTQIIRQIRDNAQDVAGTARTLSQASQQIHGGTDAQSAAASNMAAAVEEMSVSMDQVAHNSVDAEQRARDAGQQAQVGSQDVVAATREMQAISGEVSGAAQQITELGQRIEEIGSIVVVIKDVADQTNLLALNAAIEAARAGDMGRGFAVVADEVRKLAERTTQSATQITSMVNAIQSSAGDAVARMSNGTRRVSEGLQLANQASDSITRINDSSSSVVESVFGISEQVQEQRAAARDIAVNVEQIAQMAEENSVAVRNMVDSISRLENMSSQLAQTVQRFQVI